MNLKPKRIIACVVLGVCSGSLMLLLAYCGSVKWNTTIEEQLITMCQIIAVFGALIAACWALSELVEK